MTLYANFVTLSRIVSYDVMSIRLKKEKNMRYDTNSRNSRRSDFEQFSQFLGMNADRRIPRDAYVRSDLRSDMNVNSSSVRPREKSLAMVYPVMQSWQSIYDPEVGFSNGTIFEELDKPFYPTGCSGKNTEGCVR